jgi:hypothetical protein
LWDDLRTHRDLYEEGSKSKRQAPAASIERAVEADTREERTAALTDALKHSGEASAPQQPPPSRSAPPAPLPSSVAQWEAAAAGGGGGARSSSACFLPLMPKPCRVEREV